MGTVALMVVVVGAFSTAYCAERIMRWIIWRFKGEVIQLDLDDRTMNRMNEIAKHCNLSKEKVIEVLVVTECLKMMNKEKADV